MKKQLEKDFHSKEIENRFIKDWNKEKIFKFKSSKKQTLFA